MIPIVSPEIDEKEINAIKEVMATKYLAEGNKIHDFEKAFAEFLGVKHAIACTNGTTALHLSLEGLNIQPGDEVITSPFTFVASSNSILFSGSVPIFSDIKEDTWNIDPEKVEELITPKTKAIMPIHIFGLASDIPALKDIAEDRDLFIIEDACQAHGAKINGKHVGTMGDVGAFSFYATKNLITGEGGMVVTDDDDLATRITSLKNHGRPPEGGYHHNLIGYNYRATNLVGAIGEVQVSKLPSLLEKRSQNAGFIRKGCEDLASEIVFQKIPEGYTHGNYVMVFRIRRDDVTPAEVIEKLKEKGVGARQIYAVLSYEQPAYQNISNWKWAKFVDYPDYTKTKCPIAEELSKTHVEIPVVPSMNQGDREKIVTVLHEIFI
ncbi:MAG: DegT/DnrJ/EryC1/StrS family aminotransferase [Candidatus Kariarchaeaceae archaeon]